MDLQALRIAAAVAETGSMTDVARRFGVTQSAVSQAVRKAERDVGAPLVDRRRRPLSPTPAGRLLIERIGDLRRDFDALVSDLREAATAKVRVDLRLGLVDSFAGTVGARMVAALSKGAPALDLTVWSGLAASHAEALLDGSIDAAVTCDPVHELPEVERTHLVTEDYVLAVPLASAEELRDKPLEAVFGTQRLVRHSSRSFVGAQVERHLGRLALRPPRAFQFDTSDAVLAMVAAGMGVAITTPLCVLQGAGHLGGVAVLPLPGPRFARDLHVVSRRGDVSFLAPRVVAAARAALEAVAWPIDESRGAACLSASWRPA